MAFELPKIDFTDAKTRILIIFAGVVAFVLVIYLGRHFFSSPKTASGPSKVASAPGNLQSIPGGQLTPEYYRALVQANAQAAKQAQISGGSAVPTLLNEPNAQPSLQPQPTPSCAVVCPTDDNVNVENTINDLVKTGKLSAEEGKKLSELARQNVAVSDYAAHLDQLVKAGKLTPEQARKVLEDYKKQHENALVRESGATMDTLIQSGQLPLNAANELLGLQKKRVSPAEYAEKLSALVKEGKISPQTAAQLLGQYTHQHAQEASKESLGRLAEMVASGQIKPEVAKDLEDYQKRHVPVKEYEEELEHMVKQGKLTPEQARRLLAEYREQLPPAVAEELADAQKRNVPMAEYQATLQKMVAAGKITPEQAQQLLEQYRQVKNAGETEGTMPDIVRQAEKDNQDAVRQLAEAGKISPDTAQKLNDLQRAKVPIEEYQRQLEELVREGKLEPADAQRLLASYTQEKGGGVEDLVAAGHLSPKTAQKLMDLQRAKVPVNEYKRQLDQWVKQGAISPEDAQKLLNNYQQMKQGAGVQDLLAAGKISPQTAQKLLDLQRAKVPIEDYRQQVGELVKQGKISPEDAQKLINSYQQAQDGAALQELASMHRIPPEAEQKLLEMQRVNAPVEEYKKQLEQLVKEGRLSPQEAETLLGKYQKLQGVREASEQLAALRANNAPVAEYEAELKRAVAEGTLTPEQANRLLQEYRNIQAQQAATLTTAPLPNVKGSPEFAAFQKRIQAAGPAVAPPKAAVTPTATPLVTLPSSDQTRAAQAKARAQAEEQEQQRLQAMLNAMSQQAGQLINSWQPPVMSGQVGSAEKDLAAGAGGAANPEEKGSSKDAVSKSSANSTAAAAPIIKAGTIIYAILDTAVNSDYPDSPVLATIVSGPYKGAKLLGKLAITQGQDRVALTFKLMNMDEWPTGKTVNAFAIDPDTARTALASEVNYHYFLRYGGLFASSFISGYANAISSSGATTSLSVTGSTTTNPVLSPSSKLIAGFGAAGQAFGKAVQSYTTTPPTVMIKPGVSLGILFMSDVPG